MNAGAAADSKGFNQVLGLCDSVGLATFTIIGAQVALEADLNWWWMAICAALTCAGGGMLLDVVTGREPRTFQGEPYEEIAVFGALVLSLGLFDRRPVRDAAVAGPRRHGRVLEHGLYLPSSSGPPQSALLASRPMTNSQQPRSSLNQSAPILILGGGLMGLAIAHQLARRGKP